jgi:hypothetical protein
MKKPLLAILTVAGNEFDRVMVGIGDAGRSRKLA